MAVAGVGADDAAGRDLANEELFSDVKVPRRVGQDRPGSVHARRCGGASVARIAGLTVAGYGVDGGAGRIHFPDPVVAVVRDIQAAVVTGGNPDKVVAELGLERRPAVSAESGCAASAGPGVDFAVSGDPAHRERIRGYVGHHGTDEIHISRPINRHGRREVEAGGRRQAAVSARPGSGVGATAAAGECRDDSRGRIHAADPTVVGVGDVHVSGRVHCYRVRHGQNRR